MKYLTTHRYYVFVLTLVLLASHSLSSFHDALQPVNLSNISRNKVGRIEEQHGCIESLLTCQRPVVRGLPNISLDEIEGKIIIHNYGHGGSGWTLLWGSVLKALSLFEEKNVPKETPITIIGAGCMGRATAIMLFELGYHNITVKAAKIEDIASTKAAGYFAPVSLDLQNDEDQKLIDDLGFKSYEFYKRIVDGEDDVFTHGVSKVFVYSGAEEESGAIDTESGLEPYAEAGIIPPAEEGIVDFGNGTQHRMRKFQTFFLNTGVLMNLFDELMQKRGIEIQIEEVASFDAVETPVIFNCSGLGAGRLNNDDKVYPVLGHLIMLAQQDLDNLQYIIYTKFGASKEDAKYIYFIPKGGGTLGGTFIPNVGREAHLLNTNEFEEMLERNTEFFGT